MNHQGLYVIATQPTLTYSEVAKICVRQGVRYLQLREKTLSDRELLEAARQIKEVTAGTDTKFVVNDRADIALLSGADVLHLGQDDISVAQARQIVGDMPIGLSTHSIEQAKEALTHNPEYIGFGPIFPTTTKQKPDPTVGTDLLSEVLRIADVPVIAIGGIFMDNIQEVLNAGATDLSMVRYLMCDDMEQRIVEVQKTIKTKCTKHY